MFSFKKIIIAMGLMATINVQAVCPTISVADFKSYNCQVLGEFKGSFNDMPHMQYRRDSELNMEGAKKILESFKMNMVKATGAAAAITMFSGGLAAPVILSAAGGAVGGAAGATVGSICKKAVVTAVWKSSKDLNEFLEGNETDINPGKVECTYSNQGIQAGFKLFAEVKGVPLICPAVDDSLLKALKDNGGRFQDDNGHEWAAENYSDSSQVQGTSKVFGALNVVVPFKHTCSYLYQAKKQENKSNPENGGQNAPAVDESAAQAPAPTPAPEGTVAQAPVQTQKVDEMLVLHGEMVGGASKPLKLGASIISAIKKTVDPEQAREASNCPAMQLNDEFDQVITNKVIGVPNDIIQERLLGYSVGHNKPEKYVTFDDLVVENVGWTAQISSYNFGNMQYFGQAKFQDLHSHPSGWFGNAIAWEYIPKGGVDDTKHHYYDELNLPSCIYVLKQKPNKMNLTRSSEPFKYAVLSLRRGDGPGVPAALAPVPAAAPAPVPAPVPAEPGAIAPAAPDVPSDEAPMQ